MIYHLHKKVPLLVSKEPCPDELQTPVFPDLKAYTESLKQPLLGCRNNGQYSQSQDCCVQFHGLFSHGIFLARIPECPKKKRSYEPLRFHPRTKGNQVLLSDCYSRAERISTFHDGIVFTNRPVHPYEIVTLRILKMEDKWNGGLRVGFSCLNPSNVNPWSLPPFICPDLIFQSPTWAAVLPDQFINVGDTIHFWVNESGEVFLKTKEFRNYLLFDQVTVNSPLWAVMDVYGATKAIELLTPVTTTSCSRLLTTMFKDEPHNFCFPARDEEECSVCLYHATNTWLLPCGHTILCYCCANQIFRDTAKCPMCRSKIELFYLQNKSIPSDTQNFS